MKKGLLMIVWMILIILSHGQGYKIATNFHAEEVSKVKDLFEKEMEISAMAIDNLSNVIYLIPERCRIIYKYDGKNWGTLNFKLPKGFDKTEIEGAVFFKDTLYLSTEQPCALFKVSANGGDAKKVEIGTQIPNACNTGGKNGLEGIAYDPATQQFYLLVEKTSDGGNAILFKGKIAKDVITTEKEFKINLGSGFRYSDVYIKDSTMYLLRTKPGAYFIDTISVGNLERKAQPKTLADITPLIKNLEQGGFSTNMEAIMVNDKNEIYLASDNKDGGKCETTAAMLTASIILKWDTTKPAPKPEQKKSEDDPRASLTIDCLSDLAVCPPDATCKLGNDDPFCGYKLIWNPYTNCKQLIKGNCDPCTKECSACKKKNKKSCNNVYKAVPVGEPLTLELSGINPYKYDLSIKGEPVSTSNTRAFELLMETFQQALGGQFPGMKAATDPMKAIVGSVDSVQKNVEDTCELCKKFLSELRIQFNEKAIYYATPGQLRDIQGVLLSYGCDSLICTDELTVIKTYTNLLNELIEIADSLERYDRLGKDIDSLRDRFVCLHRSLLNDNNSNCFRSIITDLRHTRAQIKSDILLARAIQQVVEEKLVDLKSTFKYYEDKIKARGESLDKVFKANNTVFDSLAVRLNVVVLEFPESYLRFVIPEVDELSDYIDVTAGIKLKQGIKSVANYSSDSEKFKITVPTCKGVHFAFGSGIVTTGFRQPTYGLYGDSLWGQSPFTGNDTLLSAGKRLERLSDKNITSDINIGIAFQAFVSYRTAKYCYVGGTLGVAYSSDNSISLLVGPSFLAGKKVKFGISAGYALSTLKTPTGNYTISDTKGSRSAEFVNYKDDKITEDIGFRHNWFFSLTLDFGSFTAKSK